MMNDGFMQVEMVMTGAAPIFFQTAGGGGGRMPARSRSTGAPQRQLNSARRESMRTAAQHWLLEYLAEHFTNAGGRKYGYTPRKGEEAGAGSKAFWRSYTGRKKRRFGHTRPLVWSGVAEQHIRFARVEATATRTKAEAKIVGKPRAFNLRPPHSEVDMSAEIATVLKPEAGAMAAAAAEELQHRLAAAGSTQILVF